MATVEAPHLRLFHQRGAVLVRGIVRPRWLDVLERGIERNLANPSQNAVAYGGGAYRGDYWSWKWIPEYMEFIQGSGVAEAAARFLAARRVFFFEDNYFIKEAGCRVPTPWHQDSPYFDIQGTICAVWIPLDPHGAEDSLEFVVGSQRWGRVFAPAEFDPDAEGGERGNLGGDLEPMPDIDAGGYEIVSWAVQPGDCIFFDALTIHGNRGNASESVRRRFSCRFVDEHATFQPTGEAWSAFEQINVEPGQRLSSDGENFPVAWPLRRKR